MTLAIEADPVPLRVDGSGTVRVGGTRVTLETVLARFGMGESPEEIAEGFPTLRLSDIYTVIGYYLRHRPEVDEYLRQVEEQEEAVRLKLESQPGYKEWRERLLAQRAVRETRG